MNRRLPAIAGDQERQQDKDISVHPADVFRRKKLKGHRVHDEQYRKDKDQLSIQREYKGQDATAEEANVECNGRRPVLHQPIRQSRILKKPVGEIEVDGKQTRGTQAAQRRVFQQPERKQEQQTAGD